MPEVLIVESTEEGLYTAFSGDQRVELNYAQVKELLGDPDFRHLSKHKEVMAELTIPDWKRPGATMPIIKRTSRKRREIAGEPKTLTRFLGVQGKVGSPILTFLSKSTTSNNKYRVQVQLMDLKRWRKDKYLYNLTLPEFKEILDVADVKFHCTCKAFHWIGIAYGLTQVDSAINPVTIADPIWSKRDGHDSPSLCKHLKELLPLIKPNAGKILKQIKDRYSAPARSRNTN